jgi:hypothetical protein
MKDGRLHWKNRDLTGQTFGKLTAVHPAGSDGKKMKWVFRCQCGKLVVKGGSDVTKEVKRGGVPNCGCATKYLIGEKNRTHGMSGHPAYWVWRSMRDRCRLPSHQAWENYGARGITVCPEWDSSFEKFWEDMKVGYRSGLTLDRKDNSLGYYSENCRWTSYKIQANNKRGNHIIDTPRGPMTVSQAAVEFGIGRTTILYRLQVGCPQERLFDRPNYANRFTT